MSSVMDFFRWVVVLTGLLLVLCFLVEQVAESHPKALHPYQTHYRYVRSAFG